MEKKITREYSVIPFLIECQETLCSKSAADTGTPRQGGASVCDKEGSAQHTQGPLSWVWWVMVDLLEEVKIGGINTSHSISYTAVM